MRTTTLIATLISGLLLAACTEETSRDEKRAEPLAMLDPSRSLTPAGEQLLDSSNFAEEAPRVHVEASADPAKGRIEGTMYARIKVAEAPNLTFRYFPALPQIDASAETGEVVVDGEPAEATADAGIVTVELAQEHGPDVEVEIPFSYTLPESEEPSLLDALGGDEALSPATVGLLARWPDRLSLGHWFPLWIPPGARSDADPQGYGDISNFAAADLSLRLTVPGGWTVIDGGVRVDEESVEDSTTVTSYGTGMRDLSVAVVRDYASRSRVVDGVTVTAWSPQDDSESLDAVLDETADALTTLSSALADYPWKEFDVVSTPLAGAVGGMEWPGGTWIEQSAFAGGIPGLGDLGDLLGPLVGDAGELGILLSTTRPWTIAHEVAHSWWTILVGNDSIAAPVVDEPLAQYSACLVMRESRDDAEEVCHAQIASGFGSLGATGDKDAVADQASDEFDSPTQYGGVIYGKAAWFYLALEQKLGADRVRDALRQVVESHAFESVDGAGLRADLVSALGEQAGPLWDRWMEQVHGQEDMPELDPGPGGLGGLGGLEGLDLGDLDLENLDPELLAELMDLLGQLGSS